MIPHDLTRRVSACEGYDADVWHDLTAPPHGSLGTQPTTPTHTLYTKLKKTAKNPYHRLETVPMALNINTPPSRGNYARVSNPLPLYQSLSLSLSVMGVQLLPIAGLYQRGFCFWKMAGCCVYLSIWALTPTCSWHTHARTHKGSDRHGTLH